MASDGLEVVRERRVQAQPSAARMLADIEAIVGFGIRRPGYPADRQAEEWAARRFTELGLRDVVLEPVDMPGWEPGAATLEVWPARDRAAAVRFTGFPLPYTQGCTDLERDLVGAGAAGARDQIVVEPLTLIDLPQSFMRDAAAFSFDPGGEFDTLVQTLPFGPGFNRVADAAVEAGAAGYVGILTGFPWETADYFVPYDARSGGGPAPQPDVPAHGRAYGGGSGHAVLRGPARRQPGQRRPRGASGARGRAGAR
jgi:hypothetical protein